jgi:hypothetical protein
MFNNLSISTNVIRMVQKRLNQSKLKVSQRMLQHDSCNVALKTRANYIENLNIIDCVNDSVLKIYFRH